ncbi:calcium-activated potassium channel slowpoke-like isoform X13 [Leptotrombidium deliense]|uniref:BK channel n=1 Tax=Leptotrombidium deliense TaxID=299467 RepID=A0A443SW25_9ACAR|nr:calcium-activated potassium channel slowpoke-like isoform X13 [Leptotrombidium deliense]
MDENQHIMPQKLLSPAYLKHQTRKTWITEAKDYTSEVISSQTITGRIIVVVVFVFSMISLLVYLLDTTTGEIETCTPFEDNVTQQVDVIANIVFLIFFFVRFVAAADKMKFFIELYSLIDFFTIPPAMLSVYLNRTWLGFRYLRAVRIMSMPDILQYLNILRTSTSFRLTQLTTTIIAVWLSAGGIIHLLENSGDPLEFENVHSITYFESLYFLVVTMSTVGYGDIFCETTLGRVFIVLFILVALVVFTSSIPEIVELVGSSPKFSGSFTRLPGKSHIVVCGHINFQSVNNFIKDFLHEDRENIDVSIVFLNRSPPDWDLEAFIKLHYLAVEFFQGSILLSADLERVKAYTATACLVIAGKHSSDPDSEDSANIMRVIAIKNYNENLRVIIQLLHYHNKAFLLNIPAWNWKHGDDVICYSELKLGLLNRVSQFITLLSQNQGLIAQSCLAPGFSTIMANLFAMRSYKTNKLVNNWKNDYLYGTGMEIFTEYLSPSFAGLSFAESAILCFTKLKILLIAIFVGVNSDEERKLKINPKSHIKISEHTQGFFIANSAEEVKKAFWYCKRCHDDISDPQLIKACKCRRRKEDSIISNYTLNADNVLVANNTNVLKPELEKTEVEAATARKPHLAKAVDVEKAIKFDTTGMFHWCPSRPIEECIFDRQQASQTVLNAHVVVCLFAEPSSPLIGLRNLVMPLRASNFHYHELKHIVIVSNVDYLRREWKTLQNMPKICVLNGSPLSRADLRAVNINLCDMCVILSAKIPSSDDPTLADKETILASLNIKAMTFDESIAGVLAANNEVATGSAPLVIQRRGSVYGSNIPLITELNNDTNVQFLDQTDDDDPDAELYLSQPFACGTAFAVSVLDSLMSTTYFNSNALTLIRSLITGGATPELELLLAEGAGLRGGYSTPETLANRDRCKVGQISLYDSPYDQYESTKYGDLLIKCLRVHNMLCIGVYRFRHNYGSKEATSKRFVITNPPYSFTLFHSDMIFVLDQYESHDSHGYQSLLNLTSHNSSPTSNKAIIKK